MKKFLETLVSLVLNEGAVFEIKEEESEGLITFTIFAPPEEVGKLIGKGGKVISAIRTLCRLKAIRENLRILIKIESRT